MIFCANQLTGLYMRATLALATLANIPILYSLKTIIGHIGQKQVNNSN